MRKLLLIILIFLSVISITLQLVSGYIRELALKNAKAGIRVESNIPAKVFINDQESASAPYQTDSLKPGDYKVSLKAMEATTEAKTFWQGYAKLNEGTLTIVIRDIADPDSIGADSKETSSGEIITLEPGKGVTITSSPPRAEVTIDGKLFGNTPLFVPDLTEGEHQFIISRENFLKRSIRSKVIEGFNLSLVVDLAITEPDLTKLPQTPTTSTEIVMVKNTPTGFLRVRDNPGLSGKEIAQVKPKEEYVLLEETPGWVRIRLKDGKEGWVSSAYIQKKNSQYNLSS